MKKEEKIIQMFLKFGKENKECNSPLAGVHR
jgi:hypothetical protein